MKMNDAQVDLRSRTKQFALRIIRLYGSLPSSPMVQTLGKQLLRSGTSIGAHDREGSRARSDAEFISKLEVAVQELDEMAYWLEPEEKLRDLQSETQQLIAIFVSCIKNAKAR